MEGVNVKPRCINHPGKFAKASSYADGGLPQCGKCLGVPTVKRKSTNGKRGVYMPASLVEMYDEVVLDPHLVALGEDIATMEARARQILQQIRNDPRDTGGFASKLESLIESGIKSVAKGRLTYAELIHSIRLELAGPVNQRSLYSELMQVTEQKRKLVDSESKRLKQLGWSPETVFQMVTAIADMLKPLLTPEKMDVFMSLLADSPLFNNKQFRMLPQVDLRTKTLEEQLAMHEKELRNSMTLSPNKEGIYEPGPDLELQGESPEAEGEVQEGEVREELPDPEG